MFSFANPIFLWGLLGLAAPVLIHLINRDLFRPLQFPSLRFIFRGTLPVERKRRIRDWLLLLLRMLLFAAIIGALARPEWQSATAAATGETESELVLLVDASASMSGWNSFENARTKIDDLLAEFDPALAALVVSANGPQTVEPLTADRARLRNLLAETEPQPVAGDHRESFRQALRLFSENGPRTLAIVSDFQQSDWSPAALPEIPADIETVWIDVAETARENAAILHARALPLPDGGRQVVAEIRNFGPAPAERALTLSAGDQTLSREITLAPGETRSISFILEENAAARAELSLYPDGFPLDDRYFVWLERPPPIPVLLVAPVSNEPEKIEELFFVSRALSTQTETEWLHFAVQTLEPADLNAAALQSAPTVFLLGAAPYLDDAKWTLLHDHLANGGRLLFTPGNAPARQATLLSRHNLLDLSFDGLAGTDRRRPRPHHIEWVQPDSSLGLLFQDDAARSLSHVSFYRYTRLRAGETAEVLLRTSDNDPLLLRQNAGAGSVFATAFPFETSWTDLPLSTAFLPIIRDLVAGDLPPDHGIAHFETGADPAAIATRLNRPVNDAALAAIDPLTPAIHLVGNVPVILNAPRSESVLAQTSLADLQTAVTPQAVPASQSDIVGRSERSGHHPLWPWLALAALLLFIVEMPLAAHLRRQREADNRNPAVPSGVTSQPS